MHKHPLLSTVSQSGTCPFTPVVLGRLFPVSPFAFQRFVRKSAIVHQPSVGIKVYPLPCGCFVWVYSSGSRFLSALPF